MLLVLEVLDVDDVLLVSPDVLPVDDVLLVDDVLVVESSHDSAEAVLPVLDVETVLDVSSPSEARAPVMLTTCISGTVHMTDPATNAPRFNMVRRETPSMCSALKISLHLSLPFSENT